MLRITEVSREMRSVFFLIRYGEKIFHSGPVTKSH